MKATVENVTSSNLKLSTNLKRKVQENLSSWRSRDWKSALSSDMIFNLSPRWSTSRKKETLSLKQDLPLLDERQAGEGIRIHLGVRLHGSARSTINSWVLQSSDGFRVGFLLVLCFSAGTIDSSNCPQKPLELEYCICRDCAQRATISGV